MEIKIRGKGKNKLRLEFEGESYSLINLLRQNLWENSEGDINKAEYRKEHAYLGNFDFLVETKSGDPTEVLLEAAEKIKQDCEDFKKQIQKTV